MKTARLLVAAAALGWLALACGETNEPPTPRILTVSLQTPNVDDGAVAVTVTGPNLTSLTPSGSSYQVYWRLVSSTELRALVFGNVATGPLFTVGVSDLDQGTAYNGTVTQVADRSDELRSTTGYVVEVTAQ